MRAQDEIARGQRSGPTAADRVATVRCAELTELDAHGKPRHQPIPARGAQPRRNAVKIAGHLEQIEQAEPDC